MGRGRAKAKQTKVARDLKYLPVNMDVASLERELKGSSASDSYSQEELDEQYADLAAAYDFDDEDDEDQDPRRAV